MNVVVVDTEGKTSLLEILEGDRIQIQDESTACNTDWVHLIYLQVVREGKVSRSIQIAFI